MVFKLVNYLLFGKFCMILFVKFDCLMCVVLYMNFLCMEEFFDFLCNLLIDKNENLWIVLIFKESFLIVNIKN